ncbi:hypothetical protein FisN_18Hu018 [Fistulifera solaris]|uniref:Uncharacterized protein n=1 Tax=Fistulifera solaris TaxID=1519565 RepID=A0A1Z5JVL1_FISSO|nr:hypothetical protein FisN_18Hu018 [Fistulifera solaris]|eukprot:GAX17818.1 hypothetical protein FisN_18Hu018 [Fistulifera solaris]
MTCDFPDPPGPIRTFVSGHHSWFSCVLQNEIGYQSFECGFLIFVVTKRSFRPFTDTFATSCRFDIAYIVTVGI